MVFVVNVTRKNCYNLDKLLKNTKVQENVKKIQLDFNDGTLSKAKTL
jgi:hypothetical protein